MSRVLLDTHVFLWALLSPRKLSPKVRDILRDPGNVIHLSSASAWEVATKHRLGKLPEAGAVVDDFHEHARRFRADDLPITSAHALAAGRFASAHRDPFDRMLAAQSLLEGIPLVTNDPALRQFPIAVIW